MEESPGNKVSALPLASAERGEAYYVVGGPIQPRRACYVERDADRELLDHLISGHYCHVLAPPQSGKSSLVARAARALRREGFLTAVVDLAQTAGRERETEAGRWYYGIAYRIVRDLKISIDLQHWWQEKKPLPAVQRLNEFFWEVVISGTRAPLVIFIDGVESVQDLEHAEDLFDSVRASQDARAAEPEYDRLRFVLLGSPLPHAGQTGDLSRFRIGRPVELPDFTFEQARPLSQELGLEPGDAERALYRILYWTCGHPYLTQKLCRAVARSAEPVRSDEAIDHMVQERFLAGSAPENEPNLRTTRARIDVDSKLVHGALRLYRRVWRGRRVRSDRFSIAQEYLRNLGLVSVHPEQRLVVRNRIYGQVFSKRWTSQNLPVNWPAMVTAIAAVLLLCGVPYWYARLLPRPYVETLRLATVDYDVALDAYEGLRRIPGFGEQADELFAGVLERRSAQARNWQEALTADVELRGLYRQMDRADRLLAEFWERQAAAAESAELRDRALIYRIRALQSSTPERLRRAAALIGQDYPQLRAVVRPGAIIDSLTMEPSGDSVVTLTTDHFVQTWRTDTGLASGADGGFAALAEEFVTVRRRVAVDADGTVRQPVLRVWLDHPQPTDVWLRLVSPAGNAAEIPIRGQSAGAGGPFVFDQGEPSLAALSGDTIRGTWTLEVEDRFSGSTGLLARWELVLAGSATPVTDEPGNPILVPDPRPTSGVRVVLSPDGRRAAAVSANPETRGFLQIWDVGAGALSARVPVDPGDRDIAFDAEGRFLITEDRRDASQVRVWRADSGQPLMVLESRSAFVLPPALSVSGSVLAVAERAGDTGVRVRRVDLSAARELAPVILGGELVGMALGPEGRYLAAMDRENVVRVWDSESGGLITQMAHEHKLARLLFDRSGRWLATVEETGSARIWALSGERAGEFAGGQTRALIALEIRDPRSLSFSSDGEMVLLQTRARSYELLTLPGGAAVMAPLRHSGELNGFPVDGGEGAFSMAFDAAGTRIVTGRGTASARVWDVAATVEPDSPVVFAADDARLLAMSPKGFQLVRGDDQGGVNFLDRGQPWSPMIPEESTAGHAGPITALAYSPDGSHLVSVGADGSVLLWDAAGRRLAGQRFHHGSGQVLNAAISPDNRTIVTGGQLGARLWDGVSGEPGPVLGPGRRIAGVAFSGDGSEVLTLTGDAIEFWHSDSGDLIWSAALPAPPVSMALRAEPSQLAVALADGRLLLWDRPPSDTPAQIELRGRVLAMAYAPSGGGLLIQTDEWMHLLSVDGDRRIMASALLPAVVPAGAWQAQSQDGDTVAMATRRGAHQFGLQMLRFSSPAVPPAPESLADQENLWLSRLKLRFDTSGEVVPEIRANRKPAAGGAGMAVPARFPVENPQPSQR